MRTLTRIYGKLCTNSMLSNCIQLLIYNFTAFRDTQCPHLHRQDHKVINRLLLLPRSFSFCSTRLFLLLLVSHSSTSGQKKYKRTDNVRFAFRPRRACRLLRLSCAVFFYKFLAYKACEAKTSRVAVARDRIANFRPTDI